MHSDNGVTLIPNLPLHILLEAAFRAKLNPAKESDVNKNFEGGCVTTVLYILGSTAFCKPRTTILTPRLFSLFAAAWISFVSLTGPGTKSTRTLGAV